MRLTDDMPAVITPEGMTAQKLPPMNPPTKTGHFGWIDYAGDENTFRFDDIVGAQRGTQDGRYYVYIKGLQHPIALPHPDYVRLLKRMGWTEGKAIQEAS